MAAPALGGSRVYACALFRLQRRNRFFGEAELYVSARVAPGRKPEPGKAPGRILDLASREPGQTRPTNVGPAPYRPKVFYGVIFTCRFSLYPR